MDKNKQPQSLFSSDDILHNVETVQAKWARESARRRAIIQKISAVVIVVMIVGAFFLVRMIRKQRAALRAFQNEVDAMQTIVTNDVGFMDAKVKVYACLSNLQVRAQDILYEAVETKPSEFFIQFRDMDGDPDEILHSLGKFSLGIAINGKTEFTLKDDQGQDYKVNLVGDVGQDYSLSDLAKILNMVHAEQYGKGEKPIVNPEVRPLTASEKDEISKAVKHYEEREPSYLHDELHQEEEEKAKKEKMKEEGISFMTDGDPIDLRALKLSPQK